MAGANDGDSDIPVFARWIIVLALGSGIGNAGLTFTADTKDRYYATDATKDFQLVHQRIGQLEREIERIGKQVQHIDDSHPPQGLIEDIRELKQRTRALELDK